MLHDFFQWLQTGLGKAGPDAPSWSEALLGSLNFWSLLEGTHLLTVMLFFGTIMIVDLRMLGVVFRRTPFSEMSAKVLPLTVVGFVILITTGLLLFFSKPEEYYHNIWFRTKVILIVLAMINLVVFHFRAQKNQALWDTAEKPPMSVRIPALVSMTLWLLVIASGRYIAYNWFECGKPQSAFLNAVQECAASEKGAAGPEGS